MAALTAPRITKMLADKSKRVFPVAAGVVCWEGGMVALSGVGSAAVAGPATAATGLKIVGVADGNADNRLGIAGAVTVDADLGAFLVNNDASDPVTIADIGNAVYASDDNTVSKTSATGTKSQAGTLFAIDPSGGAWVLFS
jgi:hypothetical protein